MPGDLMIRTALYTRVSTQEQAMEGFSLENQMERLRAHVTAKGWTIAGEYVDEGRSARSIRRPQYEQMMKNIKDWDVLLVLKIDRAHRNSKNFLEMIETLRKNGKQFASVTESIDTTTPMGNFVMTVLSAVAQMESEQIGQRVRDNMTQKAKSKKGGLGSPAPYGYEYHEGVLRIVPDEAVHVRWMFDQRREGMEWTQIANELNANGIRTREGNAWTRWAVRYVVNNPVYHGHTVWDSIKQENTHAAIIQEET